MTPKQFDLGPLKYQNRPRVNRRIYQGPSQLKRRLWFYGLSAIIVLSVLFWSSRQLSQVRSELEDYLAEAASYQIDYASFVANSPASSVQLADNGMAILKDKQNLSLASLLLRVASEKDPQFRDAAVYAGFAELALADWQVSPQEATRHTETALRYLEQAETIDPIHAYTYELIALAKANLGDTDAAALAKKKAEEFATNS